MRLSFKLYIVNYLTLFSFTLMCIYSRGLIGENMMFDNYDNIMYFTYICICKILSLVYTHFNWCVIYMWEFSYD